MAKKKVIQMQEFEPLYKFSLAHAVLTLKAAWQIIDVIKTKEVKIVQLHDLFNPDTGELVVPIENNKTHYWFKFVRAAADCKLLSFENFIFTVPRPTLDFIKQYGDAINSDRMSQDEQREALQKLFGKWAKIEN